MNRSWVWVVGLPAALALSGSCSGGASDGGTSSTGTGHGGTSSSVGGSGTAGVGGAGCFQGLTSIALSPAGASYVLNGQSPAAPVTFSATGTFTDGSTKPLPASSLVWSVSRDDATPPGTIAAGVLTPNPSSGGVVHVKASDGCLEATTDVTFLLDVTIGTPSNPGDWNGPVVTGGAAPTIVYPSDQTVFPRNIFRTLFQWRTGGASEFRLTFHGPYSTVTVFTDGAHVLCANKTPSAGCWEVDEQDWSFIAGSNAGSSATWEVDALDKSTSPPTVRGSAPIDLGFSKEDVGGAIFYWSTTSAGVRRGRISQLAPEDYITGKPGTTYQDGTKVQCVACHVVSRDGKLLAAPVQSSAGQSVWITGVTPQAPPTPIVKSIANTSGHGFATISPDDAHVAVAFNGKMWSVNAATGAKEADLVTGMLGGTHPDWSPKGDEVVFATGKGDAPSGSKLARIPFTNGAWGAPTAFLDPPTGASLLFPSFSPAADWIAFAKGKGGHDDLTAQLEIVASPGGTPIELVNANRVRSNQLSDGQYQNSQPTWAPPGDYHWIAFNSMREYGVVTPQGTQQIWVAAIDLKQAQQNTDPSFPAFRVPFQGLAENNHRAYWTEDIGSGGSGGGGGAGGGGPGCSQILPQGATCDPVEQCCQSGLTCDTTDNGVTYTCIQIIPK